MGSLYLPAWRHRPLLARLVSAALSAGALAVASACAGLDATDELDIDDLRPLAAVEEVRIGDRNDPDVGFTRILSAQVGPEGELYALDGTEPRIRVYAPDGRLLRGIGRRGDGPGEFRGFPRWGVVGDTVWAFDLQANRITLFDRQGALLSTGRSDGLEVPLWSCFGHVLPQAMRPDGLFTSSLSRVACSRERPATGVEPTDAVRVPHVLFDASGAVVDTIGWDDSPPPRMARPPGTSPSGLQTTQVGGRTVMVPTPPSTLPLWMHLPDGRIELQVAPAAAAGMAEFALTRIGLQGDTLYHRLLRYQPVAYTAVDLDSVAARGARGAPGGGVPVPVGPDGPLAPPPDADVIARALRAEMRFPPFRPPVQYGLLGADESIWIRREDGDDPAARWILLDAEGLPRGELILPATVQPLWMRGDTFWAAVPDELEVPWLVRYRIAGG